MFWLHFSEDVDVVSFLEREINEAYDDIGILSFCTSNLLLISDLVWHQTGNSKYLRLISHNLALCVSTVIIRDLSHNAISGPIPPEIGQLQELNSMYVMFCLQMYDYLARRACRFHPI